MKIPRFDPQEVASLQGCVERLLGLPSGSIAGRSRKAEIVRGRVIVDYILEKRHPGFLQEGDALDARNQMRRYNIRRARYAVDHPESDPDLSAEIAIVENSIRKDGEIAIFAALWG